MVEKELLLKSPLFRELPLAALAEIATVCESISVAAGEYI